MPTDNTRFNLFALLRDNTVKRITVNRDIQNEITEMFNHQKDELINDKESVGFDGRYNPNDEEIFCIEGYSIESSIIGALQNPLKVDLLELVTDIGHTKALFGGTWGNTKKHIMFQVFDSRKVLSRKFTLLHSKDTYTKLNEPGLIIGEHIDVFFNETKLIFYSFSNARRIFDLSEYYKEATDSDLRIFAQESILFFEDVPSFLKIADISIRKKVALLQRNQVLKGIQLKDIQPMAEEFGVVVEVVNNKGRDVIKMPRDKKTIKDILRFLDEDYYTGPLTGRKCYTNSKRYLSKE